MSEVSPEPEVPELESDNFVAADDGCRLPVSGLLLEDIHCLQGEEHILKSLQNDSHYVGRKLITDVRVPGNIHREEYRDFWINELRPSSFVMDVIKSGYKLPFKEFPPPSFEGNNLSARQDAEFVRSEVKRLESLGCIERVYEQPYIVLPLSSVFSKKKRLVIDASRALNPFLKHRRLKLQDHRDIPNFVSKGDYFAIEDLDSGFL